MIAVIGDIHGCYNTLKFLVKEIRKRYVGIEIYTTGDLIDRGKYPHLVIEYVKAENIFPVLGNHECMFFNYFRSPGSLLGKMWILNDYLSTREAYSLSAEMLDDHLDYISGLPFFYNLPDCFISHAGIAKTLRSKLFYDKSINESRLDDFYREDIESDTHIIWNRGDLLDIGKLQVVGHTRKREMEIDEFNNALYLDTSAFSGERLSCAVIERDGVVEAISADTDPRDV